MKTYGKTRDSLGLSFLLGTRGRRDCPVRLQCPLLPCQAAGGRHRGQAGDSWSVLGGRLVAAPTWEAGSEPSPSLVAGCGRRSARPVPHPLIHGTSGKMSPWSPCCRSRWMRGCHLPRLGMGTGWRVFTRPHLWLSRFMGVRTRPHPGAAGCGWHLRRHSCPSPTQSNRGAGGRGRAA